MSRIAIFGGSFNPVTKAHIRTAEYVLESGLFDKVLLQPCYKSFYGKSLESDQNRIDMLNISISKSKYKNLIEVSTYEIDNRLATPTLEILKKMSKDGLISNTTYFVMGYDNINKFKSWFDYDPADLDVFLGYVKILAIPREGYSLEDRSFSYLDLYSPNTKIGEVSSTRVRKDIKSFGRSDFIFDEVNCFIKDKKIYLE